MAKNDPHAKPLCGILRARKECKMPTKRKEYPSLKIYFVPSFPEDMKLFRQIKALAKKNRISASSIGMVSIRLGLPMYANSVRIMNRKSQRMASELEKQEK